MPRVYIVEDNRHIRDAVSEYFQVQDYEVLSFDRSRGVLESLRQAEPDAIILDIMLPDMNGFLLAKRIREHSSVPIIFLTAKEAESDRVTGFEVGGDDYVVKPFSTKELFLRTEAILKRVQSGNESPRHDGSWRKGSDLLHIDLDAHKAFVNDSEVELTGAEWEILTHLAFRENRAVSRERILSECLGYHFTGSERTVDTHIANIRSRLGKSGWIETVRGYGYRFAPDSVAESADDDMSDNAASKD